MAPRFTMLINVIHSRILYCITPLNILPASRYLLKHHQISITDLSRINYHSRHPHHENTHHIVPEHSRTSCHGCEIDTGTSWVASEFDLQITCVQFLKIDVKPWKRAVFGGFETSETLHYKGCRIPWNLVWFLKDFLSYPPTRQPYTTKFE